MTLLSRLRPWPRPEGRPSKAPSTLDGLPEAVRLYRTAVATRYLRALMLRDKPAMAQAVADLQALDSDTPLALQSTNKEVP